MKKKVIIPIAIVVLLVIVLIVVNGFDFSVNGKFLFHTKFFDTAREAVEQAVQDSSFEPKHIVEDITVLSVTENGCIYFGIAEYDEGGENAYVAASLHTKNGKYYPVGEMDFFENHDEVYSEFENIEDAKQVFFTLYDAKGICIGNIEHYICFDEDILNRFGDEYEKRLIETGTGEDFYFVYRVVEK